MKSHRPSRRAFTVNALSTLAGLWAGLSGLGFMVSGCKNEEAQPTPDPSPPLPNPAASETAAADSSAAADSTADAETKAAASASNAASAPTTVNVPPAPKYGGRPVVKYGGPPISGKYGGPTRKYGGSACPPNDPLCF